MRNKMWILAINRARARILRDLGARPSPGAAPLSSGCRDLALRAPQPRLRSILPEAEAIDAARQLPSLSQRSTWRARLDADHADFVMQAIQCLEAHRLAGDFQRLAVFAPPGMLPALRAVMPERLRARVSAEYPEDIADLPPDTLRGRVLTTLGETAPPTGD